MFQRFHRDEDGKVNIVHYILGVALIVVFYATYMYFPPFIQYHKIKRLTTEVALTGTTVEGDDLRNKGWFDSRMREMGYSFPMSGDLSYIRHDYERLDISFEYDYPINHFWGTTHVLHYSYRCSAESGHCVN